MSEILPQNNGLQIFNYEGHEVRTIFINGEPWWLAKEVCSILGLTNVSQAVNGNEKSGDPGLDEDEKLISGIYMSGQTRNILCVNESGLYNLIFKSRKSGARSFKRWVTHEVLPAIRKTGSYNVPDNKPRIELFPLQEVMHDQALKNWNRVPSGHFGVLTEMYSVMVILTGKGYKLPERSKPDGSVGKAWKKYAKEHYGIDPTGMYNYLDEMDREWPSNTYALEHVRIFRDFLQDVYFIEYYPKYQEGAIKRRAKENQRLSGPNKNQQQIKGK